MNLPDPSAVTRTAILGTGLIGASWAALFLSRGLHVHAIDPAESAETRLRDTVTEMWPNLVALGHADAPPDFAKLTFAAAPGAELAEVELVQENAPEKLDLKRALLSEIEAWLSPSAVIASSTSALLIGDIQSQARHPGRCIAAHPFNPPHILPLVELSGGPETDDAVLDWAMSFYVAMGKKPVRLRRQIEGHIAGRLGAAMWREAVSLVELGVASVADIDAAVRFGPGPRWAVAGCHMVYHMGGGAGGIGHYLAHLGDSQERRWSSLGTPRLDATLRDRITKGVEEEAGQCSVAELAAERDRRLVEMLRLVGE
ncbi:3-hydroxyacyl-CoA dehydrogenase NAD-binding domain-containing protein [Limimaricola cinnabarinus]|uniref:3-hydroxyacyl-CoA dehydrogenase n=1 Tax=Limimaricola cinnabarinus LL-001 TaxID=1337093 RepID=U2Z2T0_9RHOB|nr:3-hydroxyacyl-CoA dehydrogenase NAD-binding domain-containing protein [Limimaricola cinnabarinus]GAD55352.1 3-hydroxyacyl-CoA dehydrogenase [Limimaricola cinnabarinus LL-001]